MLLLLACKKNNDNQSSDKKLIKSAVSTYPNGDQYVINYDYDNNNRLTSLQTRYTGTQFPPDDVDQTFFYDNEENLIKTVSIENGVKSVFTYTYDKGIPTMMTYQPSADNPRTVVDKLVVENGLVVKTISQTYPGSFNEYFYQNGNLIKSVSTDVSNNKPYIATGEYEYGDNKSANTGVGLKWKVFNYPSSSKNEIIKYTRKSPDENYSVLYKYTYDESGYPLTSDTPFGTDGHTITKYTYINYK
ncbi:hypothetical protein [Mucilaginibacter conchicola]|nr:hypothetical protein [Mucilaginibacter conchicola]